MGLPKASGKRRWTEDEGSHSPSKVVCTSPPYAFCAEDVIPHPPTSLPSSSSSIMARKATEIDECEITQLPDEDKEIGASDCEEETILSDRPRDEEEEEEEEEDEENFIDDEEDKDSGFIDGNSIDNSSDDESDPKGIVADASFTSSTSSRESNPLPPSPPPPSAPKEQDSSSAATSLASETELQHSLAKVLPSVPATSGHLPTTITTSTTCFVTSSGGSSTSTAPRPLDPKGVRLLTAAQGGTTVTSVYPAASVPSSTYDPSSSYSPSPSDPFPPPTRPGSPAWSCTFYDGSQPATNKYMEISPSPGAGARVTAPAPAAQSIQCDENGKSYLELGSAPPYTSPYESECFTTSPSSYNGPSYSQSYAGASPPYGSPSAGPYFGPGASRPSYSPPGPPSPSAPPAPSPGAPANPLPSPYGYAGGDSYSTYDGGDAIVGSCSSYGYSAAGATNLPYPPAAQSGTGRSAPAGHHHPLPPLPAGGRGIPQQQRCSSPVCNPTRGAPRPACYPQQRLSVLNLSMLKLNRFSRFPEPSLRRSVLICNTLRHIEREMEAEGLSMTAILAHSHPYGGAAQGQNVGPAGAPGTHHCPETIPSMPSATHHHHHSTVDGPPMEPLPSLHPPLIAAPLHPPSTPPPSAPLYSGDPPNPAYAPPPYDARDPSLPFEHPPREASLRPFSSHPQGEDRAEGAINWCSVLSLPSQTDLDSMNNNECHEWNNNEESDAAGSGVSLATLTSRNALVPSHPGAGAGPSSGSQPHNALQYSLPSGVDSGEGTSGGAGASTPSNSTWKLLPSLSADDVLKSFPEGPHRRQEEELDSIMKVFVGS